MLMLEAAALEIAVGVETYLECAQGVEDAGQPIAYSA